MAGLWKYFQHQSLPNTKETGLREVITNEANTAVESLGEKTKWCERLETKIHLFHTRAKGEDSELCSRMWQHSYCKTLQQKISHPWRKHSETVQEAVLSRAQKNWFWTRDFLPGKKKATTKTKTSLSKSEFELAKKPYLKRIKKAVADAKIPAELVINWDQSEWCSCFSVDTGRERFLTSGNCWSWG